MDEPVARIVQDLVQSKKYRHLSLETLERVARAAQKTHTKHHDALKTAKRKLHQIFAAYNPPGGDASLDDIPRRLAESPDDASLRASCVSWLRRHASTAERIEFLDQLYPALWREVGVPGTVLDLACGHHPFALPWMGLPPSTEYRACDIDHRLIDGLNLFLPRIGPRTTAQCEDLLVHPLPTGQVDVVFLLKSVPCLEQQEKGATVRILRSLRARHTILSFPSKSLGGYQKGMRETYQRMIAEIASTLSAPVSLISFPNEDFYLLSGE
jgi:16S rRNA (guanine(1405)-N(7))-methyltransferase